MATLKEVADLAGVSVATASMALNQGPVKESTRKRVLDCVKLLNYVPNRIGRTLNTGKSNTIALLMMTSVKYADIVHKTSLFYICSRAFWRWSTEPIIVCGSKSRATKTPAWEIISSG
jgi:DNA-binding LacI/PurR family transcriptional regulator